MSIALYVLAGLIALSTLLTVASVGKQRKPVTAGIAIIVIVVNAAIIVLLVLAGLRLM